MRKLVLSIVLIAGLCQNASAESLSRDAGVPFMPMPRWVLLSIMPSAIPTIAVGFLGGGVFNFVEGSSQMSQFSYRHSYRVSFEEALVVKEDAVAYLESGVSSLLLQEFLEEVRRSLGSKIATMADEKIAIEFIAQFDAALRAQTALSELH